MKLYANPYADARGFYFETADEYDTKAAALAKRGVEEFSVEFIDGTSVEVDLFAAAQVGQGGLHRWFEFMDWLQDRNDEATDAAAFHLMVYHGERDLEEVQQKLEDGDVHVFEGDMEAFAHHLVDDAGLPDNQAYFDYDAYGEAMKNDYLTTTDYDEAGEEEVERIQNMSDRAYGVERIEELYGTGDIDDEELRREYFDYEMFARDLDAEGNVEFQFAGKTWVASE